MTKLYKLTDEKGKTRAKGNELQWGEGVTHIAKGVGSELCTDGVIHAYEHPLIAIVLCPIHAAFDELRLWEAEGEIVAREGQLKCGVKTLTTVREIPVPEITLEQRVRFAISCALEVCQEEYFVQWAQKWLNGEDRRKDRAWLRRGETKAAEAAWAAAGSAAEVKEYEETGYANWRIGGMVKAALAAQIAAQVRSELNFVYLIEQVLAS